MAAPSLRHHMKRTHGIVLSQNRGLDSIREGNGDIRVVLPAGTEVGGVPSIWVPDEGEQSREDHETLHVLALEFKGGNSTGGTRTTAMMKSLWDANASGDDDETQASIYM